MKNCRQGTFTCSDPDLTELWNAGKLAAAQALENDPDSARLHVAALADFCSNHGHMVCDHLTFGQAADDLSEMIRILVLDDYYSFTGDDSHVSEHLAAVSELLEEGTDKINRNGILQETPDIGFFCYAALRAAGRMALHCDDKSASNRLFLKSMELKQSLITLMPADTYSKSLGVLYDVYPQFQQYEIASRILDAAISNAHQLLLACAAVTKAGLGDMALARVKQLAEDQSQTEPQSASVAMWWLSSHVLGVQPVEPGFRTFRIRPLTRGLQQAAGCFPTPAGDVQVNWKKSADSFDIEVTVPPGTTATLHMPASRAIYPKITCNEELIWEENVFERGVIDSIIEGEENAGLVELVLKPGSFAFQQQGAVK